MKKATKTKNKKPREPVVWFASQMERKLSEHDDRPGWQCESFEYLLVRLMEEQGELNNLMMDLGELSDSSSDANIQDVINECADIGNFAMMLADKARDLLKDN